MSLFAQKPVRETPKWKKIYLLVVGGLVLVAAVALRVKMAYFK